MRHSSLLKLLPLAFLLFGCVSSSDNATEKVKLQALNDPVLASGWGGDKLNAAVVGNKNFGDLTQLLASLGMQNPSNYLSTSAIHWQCAEFVNAVVSQQGGTIVQEDYIAGQNVLELYNQSGLEGAIIATFKPDGRYNFVNPSVSWGHVAVFKEWIPNGVRVWDANWNGDGKAKIHDIFFTSVPDNAANLNLYRFAKAIPGRKSIIPGGSNPPSNAWSITSGSSLEFAGNIGDGNISRNIGIQNNTTPFSMGITSNVTWLGSQSVNIQGYFSVQVPLSALACTTNGTQSGTLTLSGAGREQTVNVTRICGAPVCTQGGSGFRPQGCPVPPPPPADWIVQVWDGGQFSGLTKRFSSVGTYRADQGQFSPVGDNTISSIEVKAGYRAFLCNNADGSDCETATGYSRADVSRNDTASSIRIEANTTAPPAPIVGQYILKARSNNQVLAWDGNMLKLITPNSADPNQRFQWLLHQRGDRLLQQNSRNNCLEFDDSRTQNKPARFVGCNNDDPKQQMIYDGGSFLGVYGNIPEWNIRPRAAPTWCLSVEPNRDFVQDAVIIWNQDSCDQPSRRWNYDGIPVPPPPSVPNLWVAVSDFALSAGEVGGAGASYSFDVRNNGAAAGNFQVQSSNPYFTVTPASASVAATNGVTPVTVSVGACPIAGVQTSALTFSDSGLNTVVQVSRYCALPPAPSWSVNPTGVTLPSGIVGGAITSGVFTITNAGGAGNFTVTSSNPYFTLSTAGGSLTAGSSANVNISAGACPSDGTQLGAVTISGGSSSATVNVSRACAAPAPVWVLTPNGAVLSTGTVGGATASVTLNLANTGGSSGYTISSSNPFFAASPATGTLVGGATQAITVSASSCAAVGTQNATIIVTGSGVSVEVALSRACNAAPTPPPPTPPPAPSPSVPSKVQIAMTSGGRMYVTWPEVGSATAYEFTGTFDGQAVSVSGQIPAQANATAGAIAQFMTAPDAADKQGKTICLSVRAVNSSGSSAYSSLGCAPYRYYTLSTLAVTVQDSWPRITIGR